MNFKIKYKSESTSGTAVDQSIKVPEDVLKPVSMKLPYDFVLEVDDIIAKEWHKGNHATVDFYEQKGLHLICKYKRKLKNGSTRLRFTAAL